MKRGDKGQFVGILQKTLTELGYDPGPIDGIYGPKTEAAVKKYQTDLLTHPKIREMIHGGSGDFAAALESDPSSGYTLTASGEVDDTLWMALTKHHTLMADVRWSDGEDDTTPDDTTPDDTTPDDTTPDDTTGDDMEFSGSLNERLAELAAATGDDFYTPGATSNAPWGSFTALQEALRAAGFDPGPIDGIMGPLTQAAITAISTDGWSELLTTLSANTDAVRAHSAWQGAYNIALDSGLSEEVSAAMADAAVHQAQYDFYLSEGYSEDFALQLANADVPSAAKSGAALDDTTGDDGTGLNLDGTHPADGPWGTVEALQEALSAAGFNPGPIDGITGPLTQAAMEAFNVSIGGSGIAISADGWATLLGTRPGEGDPTEPPDEIVTDEDIANLAAAYGYGARWLNHEELGPILRQAAEEGWYDNATGLARLEAAIKGTDWWDDFDANERNHQLLEASDPAEAERLLDLQVDMLHRAATRLGLTIADDRVREMARAAHVENWSDYQINQNMLLEAEWAPGQAGGAVEDNYAIIDALAGDYFVDHLIDDTTKDEWARALYLGDATEMGIRNDISALAQSSFPSMEARISQGYSTRQIVAPLRQEVARLLEIDATSIDFMTDPRFQPIWQQQNDDGTTRVMSVAETGQYVRGLEDWQTTTNATNDAYRFADYIGKKFGKAA